MQERGEGVKSGGRRKWGLGGGSRRPRRSLCEGGIDRAARFLLLIQANPSFLCRSSPPPPRLALSCVLEPGGPRLIDSTSLPPGPEILLCEVAAL